uniref:Secretory calcium-binding phosphoprotein 7 n=1 Tax=Nothobranchius furzeri TaxID=105023 RepID=A0A1A8V2C5_NOTFU
MKLILLAACIFGVAFCAPQQMYKEFDIHHAPAEAAHVIPAGVPAGKLEVLLPVDSQKQPIGVGPVRGFIKQEIPQPNGKDEEVFYPFGFNQPDPAPAAPVVPVAPAAPAAPINPFLVVAIPAAKPRGDDDDEDD